MRTVEHVAEVDPSVVCQKMIQSRLLFALTLKGEQESWKQMCDFNGEVRFGDRWGTDLLM